MTEGATTIGRGVSVWSSTMRPIAVVGALRNTWVVVKFPIRGREKHACTRRLVAAKES